MESVQDEKIMLSIKQFAMQHQSGFTENKMNYLTKFEEKRATFMVFFKYIKVSKYWYILKNRIQLIGK